MRKINDVINVSMKKNLMKFFILTSIMFSGCSIDLKTKDIAKAELKEKSVVVIENFFNLTYAENRAVAFGFLENITKKIRIPLIFLLTISATLFGFFMIWKMRNQPFRILLPLFILLAGAYGNIVDRAVHGCVTDFFHLHYYNLFNFYVFNVADLLINIGLLLMFIQYKDYKVILDNLFRKKITL
jgi:signal peptidase II